MSVTTLGSLIDKQDTFEIVRDQIAAILAANSQEQESLATAAGKTPELYSFRVFTERANPFEVWQDAPAAPVQPLVNIMYDQGSFDKAKSDPVERQSSNVTFNIDCYGYDTSRDDGAGHNPGDRGAALAAQRCLRQVRNILMAAENTYLQLRGTVWSRWPQSAQAFQPAINGQAIQQVMAFRLSLDVQFNEFSPQVSGEPLERVAIDVQRAETGEIYFEADYDYT